MNAIRDMVKCKYTLLCSHIHTGVKGHKQKKYEGIFSQPDRFWFYFSHPKHDAGLFYVCLHRNDDLMMVKHVFRLKKKIIYALIFC